MDIGTKIYYRGDMANPEGFGEITEISKDKYGYWFSTKLEDGREQRHIPMDMMKEHDTGDGHTRFCTMDAYLKRRDDLLAEINYPGRILSFEKGGQS